MQTSEQSCQGHESKCNFSCDDDDEDEDDGRGGAVGEGEAG